MPDKKRLTVISLGWGIQSFTLAAMSALGELPPVDAAIHADTTYERTPTYDFAERWTPWLEARGVKVITVVPWEHRIIRYGGVSIPAYVDGTGQRAGQVTRQCTQKWKLYPLNKAVTVLLHQRKIPKTAGVVDMWIGISLDELERMKPARVQYIKHRWPLIDLRMSRWDCRLWLQKHGLEEPPKSACFFCPFHDQAGWRSIRETVDWERAVAVDAQIRKARPPYDLYVHQTMKPLPDVDLSTPEEHGQLSLFQNECLGMCGV